MLNILSMNSNTANQNRLHTEPYISLNGLKLSSDYGLRINMPQVNAIKYVAPSNCQCMIEYCEKNMSA